MIDIREWSDKTLLALADMAEQDGNEERATALRAIIAKRERDRKALVDDRVAWLKARPKVK